jgi:hypothetical protein
MFVGYCDNHARGTFRFLNLQTGKIMLSRNMKWLNETIIDELSSDSYDSPVKIQIIIFSNMMNIKNHQFAPNPQPSYSGNQVN